MLQPTKVFMQAGLTQRSISSKSLFSFSFGRHSAIEHYLLSSAANKNQQQFGLTRRYCPACNKYAGRWLPFGATVPKSQSVDKFFSNHSAV